MQPRRNGVCDHHCIPVPELGGGFLLSTSLNVALPKIALPLKPWIFLFSLINSTLGNTTLEEWQFSGHSFVLALYLQQQLPWGYGIGSSPGQTQEQTCLPTTQSSSILFMSYPVSYQHHLFWANFSHVLQINMFSLPFPLVFLVLFVDFDFYFSVLYPSS